MKKLLRLMFIILVIFNTQAVFSAEMFPEQEIEDIPLIDLKPKEFTSFEVFRSKDIKDQKKYSGLWSTVNTKINLDSLRISTIASSSLGAAYKSSNLLDGKIDTAWVEGAKDDGINQWFKIQLDATKESPTTTPFSILKVGVIPGYSKSHKTWNENNRVKTALLVIYSPPFTTPKECEWVVFRLRFKDENKLQIFEIPDEKIGYSMDLMSKTVWFKIEEVYKGTKYQDTCVSEIIFIGGCTS